MLDQTILDNIISRIVEVADPERIILFGVCRPRRHEPP